MCFSLPVRVPSYSSFLSFIFFLLSLFAHVCDRGVEPRAELFTLAHGMKDYSVRWLIKAGLREGREKFTLEIARENEILKRPLRRLFDFARHDVNDVVSKYIYPE